MQKFLLFLCGFAIMMAFGAVISLNLPVVVSVLVLGVPIGLLVLVVVLPIRRRLAEVRRSQVFVYVLEGEVVLRTESGEQLLRAGMCAGFAAGVPDGHQLINRSDRPATYLEISNREDADSAAYSDPDVDCHRSSHRTSGGFA